MSTYKQLIFLVSVFCVVVPLGAMEQGQVQPSQAELNQLLGDAAMRDKTEEVKRLIRLGADVHALGLFARSPLINALYSKTGSTIKPLVEAGADINKVDATGYSPLTRAIMESKREAIPNLIILGANIDAMDGKGRTPAQYITRYKGTALYDAFNSAVERRAAEQTRKIGLYNKLVKAINGRDKEIVKAVLDSGVDVKYQDESGYTPLHHVIHSVMVKCSPDQEAIINLLVNAGADINARDRWGNTPLALAFNSNYLDVIRLLIEVGADINVPSITGVRLLDLPRVRTANFDKDVILAMTTTVSTKDIQHYIPTVIALTMRQSNVGKDVGNIILAKLILAIINEKLVLAKKYLPNEPEANVRMAIEKSIRRVISRSPKIQAAIKQVEAQGTENK